jgi:hypothetical protein
MTGEWRRAVGKSRDTRLNTPRGVSRLLLFIGAFHHKQADVFGEKLLLNTLLTSHY